MQGIAVTDGPIVEIITAYAAQMQQVDGVAETPGWLVVGAFYVPITTDARIEMIGSVSVDGTVMRARLFDLVTVLPVSGSTTEDVDATFDERVVSGVFQLEGGRVYQMQIEVIGEGAFGSMKNVTLIPS